MQKSEKAEKAISLLLYLLPALFLIACYLFMTVTAEDVLQGAACKRGYLFSIIDTFNYNARLSDMYAWTIIKLFDYRFQFGIDTIVRLLDAAAAYGIMYIMTGMALKSRPRLKLSHSMAFGAVFMAVYLSKYCTSLYIAFSHIHNYLVIGLFTFLFLIPFYRALTEEKLPSGPWFYPLMLALGFLFGFSSNITPAAFLVAWIVTVIYRAVKNRGSDRKPAALWEICGIAGILIACVLMYGFGSGVSHYTSVDYGVDYIGISELLSSPITNGLRAINHIVDNFHAMYPCIVAIALALAFEFAAYKKNLFGEDKPIGIRVVLAGMLFVVMHILAMSQIRAEGIIRLAMPAYFVSIVVGGFSGARILSLAAPRRKAVLSFAAVMVLVLAAAFGDMARFRIRYSNQITPVLEAIRNNPEETVWVNENDLAVMDSDIFGFTQYPILQSWANSQKVYDKTVQLYIPEQ